MLLDVLRELKQSLVVVVDFLLQFKLCLCQSHVNPVDILRIGIQVIPVDLQGVSELLVTIIVLLMLDAAHSVLIRNQFFELSIHGISNVETLVYRLCPSLNPLFQVFAPLLKFDDPLLKVLPVLFTRCQPGLHVRPAQQNIEELLDLVNGQHAGLAGLWVLRGVNLNRIGLRIRRDVCFRQARHDVADFLLRVSIAVQGPKIPINRVDVFYLCLQLVALPEDYVELLVCVCLVRLQL